MGYEISKEIRTLAKKLRSNVLFIRNLYSKKKNNEIETSKKRITQKEIYENQEFEINEFKTWLKNKEEANKKHALTEELLIIALLKKIAEHKKIDFENYNPKKADFKTKLKWILLLITGTVLSGSDAASNILGLIGSSGMAVAKIFGITIVYSLLSVILFYAFSLYEVSSQMGVSFLDGRNIVDVYLNELNNVAKLIEALEQERLQQRRMQGENEALFDILMQRLNALKSAKQKLDDVFDAKRIKILRGILTVIDALAYGVTGFFSGVFTASSIAGIFMTTVPTLFLPAILTGVLVGLCALYVYFYMQKPSTERFVELRLGLDPEKLHSFEEKSEDLGKRLDHLKSNENNDLKKDMEIEELKDEILKLQKRNKELERQLEFSKTIDTKNDENFIEFSSKNTDNLKKKHVSLEIKPSPNSIFQPVDLSFTGLNNKIVLENDL